MFPADRWKYWMDPILGYSEGINRIFRSYGDFVKFPNKDTVFSEETVSYSNNAYVIILAIWQQEIKTHRMIIRWNIVLNTKPTGI